MLRAGNKNHRGICGGYRNRFHGSHPSSPVLDSLRSHSAHHATPGFQVHDSLTGSCIFDPSTGTPPLSSLLNQLCLLRLHAQHPTPEPPAISPRDTYRTLPKNERKGLHLDEDESSPTGTDDREDRLLEQESHQRLARIVLVHSIAASYVVSPRRFVRDCLAGWLW